jgi:DNA-binding transcriptional LysR family regulator
MDNFKRSLPPLSRLVPFEAAARLESFTKASDELHLTLALELSVAHTLGRRRASYRATCIQRCLRRAMGKFSKGNC